MTHRVHHLLLRVGTCRAYIHTCTSHECTGKKKKVLTAAVELPKRSAILQNRFAMRAPARAHSGCTRVKQRLPRSSSRKQTSHKHFLFFPPRPPWHTLFARCSRPLLGFSHAWKISVPPGVAGLFLIRGGHDRGVLCRSHDSGPRQTLNLQLADGDECSNTRHQNAFVDFWDCESSGGPSGQGCSAFLQARDCSLLFLFFFSLSPNTCSRRLYMHTYPANRLKWLPAHLFLYCLFSLRQK